MELIIVINTMVLMIFHYIGDFVFQTRYMAENKSDNTEVLLKHCSIYSIFVTIGALVSILVLGFFSYYVNLNIEKFVVFFMFIFVTHLITDGITSKISKKLYQINDLWNFRNIKGIDQWLHLSQVLIIFWSVFSIYNI